MKLKWYDWDGDTSRDMKFIKSVTAVKFKDGSFIIDIDNNSVFRQKPLMWFCWQAWSNSNIIAYTMGEPLEVDCRTCKHDGDQPWFPSGCTGCCADKEYENYEPLEGGE